MTKTRVPVRRSASSAKKKSTGSVLIDGPPPRSLASAPFRLPAQLRSLLLPLCAGEDRPCPDEWMASGSAHVCAPPALGIDGPARRDELDELIRHKPGFDKLQAGFGNVLLGAPVEAGSISPMDPRFPSLRHQSPNPSARPGIFQQ